MMVNLLINETLERINRKYQPGTLPWMKVNRPNEWEKIVTLERKVNKPALEGNLKALRGVLNEYQGLILAMVGEFKNKREKKEQGLFSFVSVPKSPWDG